MQGATLTYDGTFQGLLSCIFYAFEHHLEICSIQKTALAQPSLFNTNREVITDEAKAIRIWNAILSKSRNGGFRLYATFLSEKSGMEDLILRFLIHFFKSKQDISSDYGNPDVLQISQIAKMVSREKHRMEAFVRFKLTLDDIYFSTIAPDFDVLPLIQKHFASRYADQKWLIYDIKRKYGLFYDLETATEIELPPETHNTIATNRNILSDEEIDFEELWKTYFRSTNIPSRKNTKLHIRHVPRRYWKYLSEKSPF